ncbi:MAG: Stp1/IreP family PP2C-type Ser/Thr phosphatase [Bdellovibrionia bacterium]
MKFDAWFVTDKGLWRESNQDSCLINKELGLFIVADGMGGHSGGEVASSLAVETLEKFFLDQDLKQQDPRDLLSQGYQVSSRKIYDMAANERPELAGMGTTMVAAYLRGNTLYIANVGDSRCYLFHEPYLWQVTEDHSLINEQLRAGLITEDQIKTMAGRNVITRSVGYERDVLPDIIEREVQPGETYLFCSDGLSGMVVDNKINEILMQNSPAKAAQQCVDAALANGGDDNVTVLILNFPKE